jgi:hypothetical protein
VQKPPTPSNPAELQFGLSSLQARFKQGLPTVISKTGFSTEFVPKQAIAMTSLPMALRVQLEVGQIPLLHILGLQGAAGFIAAAVATAGCVEKDVL